MRYFALLITLTLILCGSDSSQKVRAEILQKIFINIHADKELVLWSDNNDLLHELSSKNGIKTADNIENATLLVLENEANKMQYQDKYVFVLSYNLLSKIERSFGAFFWKKGRPNIVILSPRIQNQGIKVSYELTDYLEEKIW